MKKFEYKQEFWQSTILNEEGQNGWELCCLTPDGQYIFKREIQEVKTLDQTPAVGKRVSFGSECFPYDTGIIEKIEGYKVWVRWPNNNVLYIWNTDFEKGRARVIE